ncbi:SUGP1 protein, partial [Rhipidura dahli]|nr:SUGP1 protein [Rhipidura dahli]
VQDLKGLGYEKGKPVGLVGVTELSEAQKKQLKEQQELQQVYALIVQHKRAMQEMQLLWEGALQRHRHGYDSDEEVDSELGTWEHQLRRMEMDKTRGWKDHGGSKWMGQGTRIPKGKAGSAHPRGMNHPGRLLERTDPTWGNSRGKEAGTGHSRPQGIGKENPGAPQGGDSCGNSRGRGSCERSLSRFSGRGTTAVDGAGFGIERPAELTKEDDEYEAFRKRMMLAYRFRPNPLNNPRRPYY